MIKTRTKKHSHKPTKVSFLQYFNSFSFKIALFCHGCFLAIFHAYFLFSYFLSCFFLAIYLWKIFHCQLPNLGFNQIQSVVSLCFDQIKLFDNVNNVRKTFLPSFIFNSFFVYRYIRMVVDRNLVQRERLS